MFSLRGGGEGSFPCKPADKCGVEGLRPGSCPTATTIFTRKVCKFRQMFQIRLDLKQRQWCYGC